VIRRERVKVVLSDTVELQGKRALVVELTAAEGEKRQLPAVAAVVEALLQH
jgi:hypothetical protein